MRIIIRKYKNTKKCAYQLKSALYRPRLSPQCFCITAATQVPMPFVASSKSLGTAALLYRKSAILWSVTSFHSLSILKFTFKNANPL